MTSLYCIDTCSLIHGYREVYPPEHFPRLWQKLEGLIGDGRLIAPNEVMLELKQGDDDLARWARAQKGLFVPHDLSLQRALQDLQVRHTGFSRVASTGPLADPWLIALATLRNGLVVTEEVPNGHPASVKIPDVCKKEGLSYVRFVEIIKREGWSF